MFPALALLNDVGGGELFVLVIIGLLLFGRDLPQMSRKFGKMVAEFKRGLAEASAELQREVNLAADELDEAKRVGQRAAGEVVRTVDDAARGAMADNRPAGVIPTVQKLYSPPEEPQPAVIELVPLNPPDAVPPVMTETPAPSAASAAAVNASEPSKPVEREAAEPAAPAPVPPETAAKAPAEPDESPS